MPRFHFYVVEDGRVITDEEGQELTERDAVRREAVETAASVAREMRSCEGARARSS